jgi:E3 ubiquitin-protein ligase HUWE1
VLLQGDINHWVPVLDHFDSFFEEYTSKRADVQLRLGEEGVQADPPFPTAACLAVLSATCVLLENCSNKAAYNSSEVRFDSNGFHSNMLKLILLVFPLEFG